MSTEEITVDTGYAANLSRDDSENYLTVSGVAIGEDEVTSHAEGDKLWTAEQLMAGTQSLVGVQLTKNHDHNRVEGVIGEVTDARYKEGVGILFEAQVYDEDVANKIQEGLLEVSVHAIHSNGGFTENGEMIVENIEFRDLSVVPRGAAESNEVRVGSMEPATLSTESIEDMVGDEFETELAEDADEVWERFQDITNMTAAQLRSWSENPCSREASQDPSAVIKRNLRLLSRNKSDWTDDDVADAKRTISFVSRMREQKPADPRDGPVEGCPSKWAISLLNWAYNPFESMPEMPQEMDSVDEITLSSDEDETEASAVHTVSYEGTEEDEWSAPNLSDFPAEYFDSEDNPKFDLVDDHFLYSETEFPPEKYTELKFPVVSPDGMLNLAALRAAKSRAPQADIPESDITEIQETVNELAQSEFDKDWADDSAEESDDGDSEESQSSLAKSDNNDNTTMTDEDNTEDIDVEALQERVATLEEQNESLESEVQSVRMEYAEALEGESFSAEELADKFTVEELAEKYEDADVQIAEESADPDPQTGSVEEEEVEASEEDEQDEEIALLEAQIEQYDDMGWDGAKASAEAELSTLRDEDAE